MATTTLQFDTEEEANTAVENMWATGYNGNRVTHTRVSNGRSAYHISRGTDFDGYSLTVETA